MSTNIAFYLRLSMSDGDLGKNNKVESNSIENQRMILQSYVDANDELVDGIVEYIDDGYSGTNFNRPSFKRMIEDAKKGKIHTIIVKDLSRLGRDYIVVGEYIEQIFPLLEIRFIAVNSNYDSKQYIGRTMGLDMALSNLSNDFYSKDLSRKMKSALRTRWKQGCSTSGRLPYGYVKNQVAKGGWQIDLEAAKVVKLIFEKANEGWSTSMIAEHLNEQKIVTPSVHREAQNQYGGRRKVPSTECLWDGGKIRTILNRYEYT
jgi:DNA invertase Pin-like site-specific DNA recombinase